eukprot:4507791-Prymnesium_polylepis.2
MREHAAARAVFLFDDQCNVSSCTAQTPFAGGPTLAVCDLVSAGMLVPLDHVYVGDRQWALYKLGGRAGRRLPAAALQIGAKMPCTPRCALKWQLGPTEREWWRATSKREQHQQSLLQKQSCAALRS